jgi:hypothetical protein
MVCSVHSPPLPVILLGAKACAVRGRFRHQGSVRPSGIPTCPSVLGSLASWCRQRIVTEYPAHTLSSHAITTKEVCSRAFPPLRPLRPR